MSAGFDQTLRAQDDLRRGRRVAVEGEHGTLALLPVETAAPHSLESLDRLGGLPANGGAPANLIISAGRAATLKLINQRDAATPDGPVEIERAPWIDFDIARAIADPQFDLATPLKGPFRTVAVREPWAAQAALALARDAGILPAFFVAPWATPHDKIWAGHVNHHHGYGDLQMVTRARLPMSAAEEAEIVGFRDLGSKEEHVALLIGQPTGRPPLVRLHSECLTGDVFGSLKCDCGPQLDAAIAAIAQEGWGILLYLRQEGRGIGLINKLRAYALQDQGFDTVDANTRLGLAVDARDFGVAARMLQLLGQDRVRLLTNNPAKVAALAAGGIAVVERVPHALPPNRHNERYLATKRDRTGHQL